MKKQITRLAACLTMFSMILSAVTPAWAIPPRPSGFWGTAQVSGQNVPDGTVVSAWINGTRYTATATLTWNGDSFYSIDVPGDDPDTPGIEGGHEGDTIIFKIGEQTTNQTGVWHEGSNVELNLTISSEPDITVSPPSLPVALHEGDSTTAALTIGNVGSATLSWSASVSETWVSSVSPSAGSTAPGGSTAISIGISASGLAVGTYNGALTIASNDPDEPTVTVPIHLTVSGAGIDVYVPPSTQVMVGTRVAIPVYIDTDVTGIGISSFAFTLQFDASQLGCVGVGIANTLSADWNVVPNCQPAQIRVAGYSDQALAGSGPLVYVTFDVAGELGSEGTFAFSEFRFNEGEPPAIPHSGTIIVGDGFTVAGAVAYYQNMNPVSEASIVFSGPSNLTTTTNAAGTYVAEFTASGSYAAKPTKTGAVDSTISALDAAWAAQYDAGLRPLAPEQVRAGDVTENGALTAYDASKIMLHVVGNPDLGTCVGEWRFDPPSRQYANLGNDLAAEDYTAYLMGDVTANWTASSQLGYEMGENVEVHLPALEVGPGQPVTISIAVNDVTGLGIEAYEGVLSFDPEVLTATAMVVQTGTLSKDWTVAQHAKGGEIHFAAYGLTPMAGEGTLLAFVCQATGHPGEQTALTFTKMRFNEGQPSVRPFDGQLRISVKVFLPLVICSGR
ncbi:MAG: hypothetical protein KKA73_22715 [Chloroflexi bacterium]|nr:hypothetical protein [Chloroflexota bacterium]MBU1750505.1 hypothetical protein [Chloroflexota bacterium]